ncbi:hypothetical protein Leryth_020117 [Lithospermum erythrorhizon]|nr:hypothetical protein Leryth_020117 [Lithospermum erythrorhizon]
MDAASCPTQLKRERRRHTFLLAFQSLGVVYGRLCTAPLYVFGSIDPRDIKSENEVYELFSFIFWTITILPLLKYAFIVLKADNDGEGGTFSLYALLCKHAKVGMLPSDKCANEIIDREGESPKKIKAQSRARRAIEGHKSSHYLLLFLALFGSCMIIADGVLTPSISVLSATKGIGRSLSKFSEKIISSEKTREHVDKFASKYLPVSSACAILVALFALQHYGTHKIGFMFAPVIIIWLAFIVGLGLYNIVYHHQILWAISPVYLFRFFRSINFTDWKLLGNIVLCIAGSEAMFTDLGHFSKKSIKVTFVFLVYPALVICYAGQAAFISQHLGYSDDIVHLSESIPDRSIHHVFSVLSLFASVVGSQATVTASFSIINQCQALACFPRVKVIHTSEKIHGQVYIPDVNWIMMTISLAVTIGFHDIKPLGYATGFAVICAILVTTCLMSLVISLYWEKNTLISGCFLIFFGAIEAMYLSSSLMTIPDGAWFVIVLMLIFMAIMISWHYGTVKKYEFDIENKVSVEWLTDLSPGLGVSRVPGIGFIYTDVVSGIPAFFSHFIANLPAFHHVLIFVSFKSLPEPHIPQNQRYLIGRVGPKEYKIYRCVVLYGYRDHVRDIDDFEEHIIGSIGEFIAREEHDHESLISPEGKMMVFGGLHGEGAALIPQTEIDSHLTTSAEIELQASSSLDAPSGSSQGRQRKVRFTLPPDSPRMHSSVRAELQELVDARESGTAYFLGKSHYSVSKGSNIFKRLLITTYILLDKNCREPTVALNIPLAALLEVGTVYTI